MKKLLYIVFISLVSVTVAHAQDNGEQKKELIPVVKLSDNVSVKFGGFVRAEYYIDSRKPVGAVDNLFGFFPDKEVKDSLGNDQNAVVTNNLSTQATRFNAAFTGPDVFNAKSTAFLEYDFTGGNRINVRLRHAYLKLNWTKSELLVGKTWIPLAETIFPSVNGLHTGIPFRPFGRGDQVRFTYKPGKINILAAAVYQSEHTSTYGGSGDIKANPIPDFHLQLHYKTANVFAGLVSEYKIVRPNLISTGTDGVFNTNETVSSYAFGGFAEYKHNKLTVKGSALYGQNLSEVFQQGGYAVTEIDPDNGNRSYSPSNSVSSWVNITYGQKVIAGLFGGYQKNLGFSDDILGGAGSFFGRWQDVAYIYRLSPSVQYKVGRLILAAELDYNIAAYGKVDITDKGKVKDAKEIAGTRGLLAATFLF